MIFNIGTNEPTYDFSVTGFSGAKVTIANEKGSITKTTGSDGSAVFEKLKKGNWQVTATDGKESAAYEVQIGRGFSNTLNINSIPTFLYNGSYKIVDDNDNVITQSLKNWKIRFLSTGTLNFRDLNGAAGGIDVFCVGGGGNGGAGYRAYDGNGVTGGGGGGGGGRTTTKRGVSILNGTYNIVIGGAASSSIFSDGAGNKLAEAAGGESRPARSQWDGGWDTARGGKGGSGGGGGSCHVNTPSGGQNGGSGSSGANNAGENAGNGGSGLDASTGTREFHESNGTLYASGGAGGGYGTMKTGDAAPNTGNGGNGGASSLNLNGTVIDHHSGTKGGSGIVIIRNKR